MWRTSRARESELLDLVTRGERAIELDAVEVDEKGVEARVGRLDVAQAEARLDQDEPLIRLDEQAVADEARRQTAAEAVEERAAERAHAAAIEVMDAHD
jgi:predicted GNAT family acetyltransferase